MRKANHRVAPESYPRTRPYVAPSTRRRRRTIPDRIDHYYIPLPVLEATDAVMRRCGREERECYVWWAGYFDGSGSGQVITALWPDVHTQFGRVRLGPEELSAMHTELMNLDQVVLAELHTHPPGAGGQNEVDAAHAAAPYPGFISIVVPDFAFPYLYDLRQTYVYEYVGAGEWRELDADDVTTRLIIEEPFREVRASAWPRRTAH